MVRRAIGVARLRARLLPLGVRGRPDPAFRRANHSRPRRRQRSWSCWCSRPRGGCSASRCRSCAPRSWPTASWVSICLRRSRIAATSFDQIIDQLYLGTEGIYGIPTLVSATYIFLFILFGSFLEHAGMIGLFNQIAMGFVGHARGGPAKVAVISSGLMGMISGSGIANVMTIGPVHDPADEAFRLLVGVCGRRRGNREHGRPDHAARDGRRRVHHGRDARRSLCHHRQSGDHSGAALLRDGVLDGAYRGRSRAACSACPSRMPESLARDCSEVASAAAAGRAGRTAVRRLDADVRRVGGPGADGDPDSRRWHRRRLRLDAFPHRLLGDARSRAAPLISSWASIDHGTRADPRRDRSARLPGV